MKVVLQDGIKDCGICCLLSIIRYYGGEVPKEILREMTNTTKDGVSLYNLLEASNNLGFESIGVSGNLEDIALNNLPCIAHVQVKNNRKHFIVIYEINKESEQVIVMDPAKGKRKLSFSEFNLLSSKYYLFLKPKKKIPILKKKNIVYQNIIKLFKEHQQLLIVIFLLTTNYFILNIITSFHFKYLIEYTINKNVSNNLLKLSISLLVIYLMKNIIMTLRDILLNKWSSLFTLEVTTFLYQQILLLPYLYFKNRTTGEVISRFQDLGNIRDYLTILFSTITIDLVSCIIFLILMWNYQKTISSLICIILLVSALYTIIISKSKKRKMKMIKQKEDIANSYIIQGITNVDTIKGSHIEKRLIDKFNLNYKSLQESIYNYLNFHHIENFIKNNLQDSIFLILYGLGSYYCIRENMNLSSLIIYSSFVNYYSTSFSNIINLISNYHSYNLTLDRVEELFMLDKEEFKHNYFYLPYQLKGDICIHNLSYKIGTKVILDNLNLNIKHGEKVLLCGDSGSGKSTLMKMLMRYIQIDFDKIKIANIDINHYHLQNIRNNITYLSSNEYLFQDSIKNNICMYQDYQEEDIKEVCDICFVDEILKSKNITLDSIIEENGFNFSNGERQRIILARSLLRNTSIYILDEALAQIDINKEKKILEKLFTYLKDKTVIVISHRFNNKKVFDRVLKLEKGKINETKKL